MLAEIPVEFEPYQSELNGPRSINGSLISEHCSKKVHMEKRIWHNEDKDKALIKESRRTGFKSWKKHFLEHFLQGISTIKEKSYT